MPKMMTKRSVHFVSLDTHPANNALVVTYETCATVFDADSNNELCRRSKRDQILINISALDNLQEEELKADKLMINLQEISSEILRKCPMLVGDNQPNSEDIQLHLLYLIGRRRSQLLTAQTGSSQMRDRPPSSTSVGRHSSACKTRLASANQRPSSLKGSFVAQDNRCSDIFSQVLAAEQQNAGERLKTAYNEFIRQICEYLSVSEETSQQIRPDLEDCDVETLLEGLYGDLSERRSSMVMIRRLSCQERGLSRISSDRLLICAMLRTLRDSDLSKDSILSESILYCLIRFTEYEDIFMRIFGPTGDRSDTIDLCRTVADLLSIQVASIKATAHHQQECNRVLVERHFQLSSMLIILENLYRFDEGISQVESLLANPELGDDQKSLASSLIELFHLGARHLIRDVRLSNAPTKSLSFLQRIVLFLLRLSISKGFLIKLRSPSNQFTDSLVSLLAALQLSRSSSIAQVGGRNEDWPTIDNQQILIELYVLEIQLLRLTNNLMSDQRLKIKLVKKNLLKCVLRNLIVFLASSRDSSNTLAPYQRSSVLKVPFKCLYELTRLDQIKAELSKSKIVLKCLLEYLLSATMDLKSKLSSKQAFGKSENLRTKQKLDTNEIHQIVVEPDDASHYIVGLWVNLSGKNEATIDYMADAELSGLFNEYIDMTVANLGYLFSLITGANTNLRHDLTQLDDWPDLMIYLHAKLLRNLSQSFNLDATESCDKLTPKWLQSYAEFCKFLIVEEMHFSFSVPLSVECLATLNNLIGRSEKLDLDSLLVALPISPLIRQLLSLNLGADLDAENDDLLLVSVIFVGTLARRKEVCTDINSIGTELIQASSYILETRSTDQEMIISCLHALSQLLNHSDFLFQVSSQFERPTDAYYEVLERLLDSLAAFVLHANAKVARLAALVLNRLRWLEEQRSVESLVHKKRFAGFNSKWLQEIRSNRDLLTRDETFSSEEYPEDEHLRALSHERRNGSSLSLASSRADSGGGDRRKAETLDAEEDDDDECEAQGDCLDAAPDLNVIDAESMIKHLTSRRELRSAWLLQ